MARLRIAIIKVHTPGSVDKNKWYGYLSELKSFYHSWCLIKLGLSTNFYSKEVTVPDTLNVSQVEELYRKNKKDYDFVAFIVDKLPIEWEGKAEAYMDIGYFVSVNKNDSHPFGPLWTLCYEMSHEFLHMLLMHLNFSKEIWHDLVHTNDKAPRYPDFWYKQRLVYWLHHPYYFVMKYMVTIMKWVMQDFRTVNTKFSTVGGDYLT